MAVAAAAYTSEDAPRPFLPNLTTLNWSYQPKLDQQRFPPFAIFLTPRLVCLKLEMGISESRPEALEQCRSIFGPLSKISGSVQKAQILLTSGNAEAWDEALSGWLATCRQLEDATLPLDWKGRIVEVLGCLPSLRSIKINRKNTTGINTVDERHFMSVAQDADTFPTLISVAVESHILPISNALRAPKPSVFNHLQEIELIIQPGSPKKLEEMFTLLAKRCPALSTVVLMLRLNHLSFRHLEPLLSLLHMTKFRVDYRNSLTIGPQETQQMCQAWPQLRIFQAGGSRRSGGPGISFSYDTLPVFAAYSAQLQDLTLRFTPGSGPQRTADAAPAVYLKALQYLDVGDSDPPENHLDMAFFLAQVCGPDTQLVWGSNGSGQGSVKSGGWKSVEEVFRRAARMKPA